MAKVSCSGSIVLVAAALCAATAACGWLVVDLSRARGDHHPAWSSLLAPSTCSVKHGERFTAAASNPRHPVFLILSGLQVTTHGSTGCSRESSDGAIRSLCSSQARREQKQPFLGCGRVRAWKLPLVQARLRAWQRTTWIQACRPLEVLVACVPQCLR